MQVGKKSVNSCHDGLEMLLYSYVTANVADQRGKIAESARGTRNRKDEDEMKMNRIKVGRLGISKLR